MRSDRLTLCARSPERPRLVRAAAALLALAVAAAARVPARADEPPPFTAAQLDQMLAPIALFPDALLSQVLMASTYPADVALAVEWAYAHRPLEGDAAVKAARDEPWDPSVQSLVAFPQALAMLGENPQWVQQPGGRVSRPARRGDGLGAAPAVPGEGRGQPEVRRAHGRLVRGRAAPAAGDRRERAAAADADRHHRPRAAAGRVRARLQPRVGLRAVVAPGVSARSSSRRLRGGAGGRPSIHVGFWWGRGVRVQASLWGGVDWRRRNVTINVNHWNTVHVHHRIDSRSANVSLAARRAEPARGAVPRRGDAVAVPAGGRGPARERSVPRAGAAARAGSRGARRSARPAGAAPGRGGRRRAARPGGRRGGPRTGGCRGAPGACDRPGDPRAGGRRGEPGQRAAGRGQPGSQPGPRSSRGAASLASMRERAAPRERRQP